VKLELSYPETFTSLPSSISKWLLQFDLCLLFIPNGCLFTVSLIFVYCLYPMVAYLQYHWFCLLFIPNGCLFTVSLIFVYCLYLIVLIYSIIDLCLLFIPNGCLFTVSLIFVYCLYPVVAYLQYHWSLFIVYTQWLLIYSIMSVWKVLFVRSLLSSVKGVTRHC